MCTFAVICNGHITGPLAGESAAKQLFKVRLFPLAEDGPEHPAGCQERNLVPKRKKAPFDEAAEAYFCPLTGADKSESTACDVRLTQSSEPLQFVLALSGVRPADLENLVLAIAAGLAQQSPVGA